MKCDKSYMNLYAVTDRAWLNGRKLCDVVEEAILGGVTMVQLREKHLSDEEFLQEAGEVQAVCRKYQIPFLINDNVKVALACNADGVHVGQDDMPMREVRKILGEEKIIGVSAQTVEQALQAEADGADYLGVGAVFSTSTKLDAVEVPYPVLKEICQKVTIPVCAIGGVKAHNIIDLQGSGIDGVAVVSGIFAAQNVRTACEELLATVQEVLL